jgi:hypothetical protein
MNPEHTRRRRTLWLVGLMSCCLLSCSFVTVDQQTRYRDAEGYFEPRLLESIKVGETSRTWLLAHFGRPWYSEVDALVGYPTEVQIDSWRFEREQQKNTRVFLLFRSRNLAQQYEYLHVVSEGDTVKRAWRDVAQTVDTPRLMAAMGYRKTRATIEERRVEPPAATPQPEAAPEPAAVQSVPAPASLTVQDVSSPATSQDGVPLTDAVDPADPR